MKKIFLLIIITASSFQLTCAATNNIPPSFDKKSFPGFNITNSKIILSGYEYTTGSRRSKSEDIAFTTCKHALNYDISKIIEFEYFRFKMLVVSCNAVNKFRDARKSNQTYFPSALSKSDIKSLPSLTHPYLSKTDYKQRENLTISQQYKENKITLKKNKVTLVTKEDEIHMSVLARGDFNNDKIEDLLVSSEWYARNAFGKHTDLVILSKISKDSPITIQWRLNKPR